jgi:hypothetical protein
MTIPHAEQASGRNSMQAAAVGHPHRPAVLEFVFFYPTDSQFFVSVLLSLGVLRTFSFHG